MPEIKDSPSPVVKQEKTSQLIERISDLSNFSGFLDNDNHVDSHFLESLINKGFYIPYTLLSEKNLKNFNNQDKVMWSLYRDIGLNIYNNYELVNKFFTENIPDFSDKFLDQDKNNNFYFNSHFLETLINKGFYIPSALLSEKNLKNFNNQDIVIWSLYRNIVKNNNKNYQYVIKFFANNISDFPKFIKNDKPNSLFLKSLLNSKIEIPKELLSEEKLINFSDQDKIVWSLYRDVVKKNDYNYQLVNKFFTENISDFSDKFLDQDKNNNFYFNSQFLDSLLNSKIEIPKELLSEEKLINFSDQDKIVWSLYRKIRNDNNYNKLENEFITDNISDFSKFIDQDNHFNSQFLEALVTYDINIPENFLSKEKLVNFNDHDKVIWSVYRDICEDINYDSLQQKKFNKFFADNISDFSKFIDQDNHFNSQFLEAILNSGIDIPYKLLSSKNFINFNHQDKAMWTFIRDNRTFDKFIVKNKDNFNKYIVDNKYTLDFFNDLKINNNDEFVNYFKDKASKGDWITAFGKDTIDSWLSILPTKTDEKRNAFTHNEYDRTSQFFKFLIDNDQIKFNLTSENIKLATEYIQNFGLAKSPIIFEYFTNIKKFENGDINNLPIEYTENKINSVDNLKNQINELKKKCFIQESITNPQELNQFQKELLSIITGHAINRWTRIPLDQIISDFSSDLAKGQIARLDSHFKPTSLEISKLKTKVKEDLSKNIILKNIKQEIVTAINGSDEIDNYKSKITDLLTSKIAILSSKESNDFIKKQINSFTSHITLINQSDSIDSLIEKILTLNLNLGSDKNRDYQQEFNSVLRQLVFQKAVIKHQSPEWRENLKNNILNNNDVSIVTDSLNFLSNIIKTHALNLNNNDENYWDQKTFETLKKYSKVFKNNLAIGFYIKELQEIEKMFEVTKENSNLKIAMIPDRGLIGEMSGYLPDVCYTKVYPLLKQYPNLTPYKFIDQSDPNNPEFIGSVLVFRVDSTENDSVFLIRAFNVPNEQEIDIGIFFEKFVDSLSQTAKELGVKKIIAAGTSGTISNYLLTQNYFIDKYVKGGINIPLKEKFDFNNTNNLEDSYDITKKCYLVRDLT